MASISYAEKNGVTQVHLERNHIGDIKKNPKTGKFFYKVKGSKHVGDEMASIAEVKLSLEAE